MTAGRVIPTCGPCEGEDHEACLRKREDHPFECHCITCHEICGDCSRGEHDKCISKVGWEWCDCQACDDRQPKGKTPAVVDLEEHKRQWIEHVALYAPIEFEQAKAAADTLSKPFTRGALYELWARMRFEYAEAMWHEAEERRKPKDEDQG